MTIAENFYSFVCPVPLRTSGSCDATVADLSACLNEVASFQPVTACVSAADCDGGIPDAAGAPPLSSTPACERLYRICPGINRSIVGFPSPCGG